MKTHSLPIWINRRKEVKYNMIEIINDPLSPPSSLTAIEELFWTLKMG